MDLNTLLDVDLVALESHDRVTVLLELAAPSPPAGRRRPPGTLQVVLDRSGSMADGRLEAAQQALLSLIERLDPQDRFGLVCFDDQVQVPAPAGPLVDKAAVRRQILHLGPGGMTNLSDGLIRGLQEADRVCDGGGATLVVLSDGHANRGIVEHDRLQAIAAAGRGKGVTTSTIGIGLDYDEALLSAVADGGAGNAHFAEDGDQAGAKLASEVDGLLEQVAQAASLIVRPSGAASSVTPLNDLPVSGLPDGFMVELGDFVAGERRRLVLDVTVPAMPALGLAMVLDLELRWTETATLTTHAVTAPVHVNVVPGDAAAGRVPDPVVTSERLFQQAQRAKRAATDAAGAGDVDRAQQVFNDAADELAGAAGALPASAAGELLDEVRVLRDLADRAGVDDQRRLAKMSRADWHRKSRKRGR